jgi:hypothetical protein
MRSPSLHTEDKSSDRDAEIAALFERLAALAGPDPDESPGSVDEGAGVPPGEDTALIDIRRLARSYSEAEPPLEDDDFFGWDPKADPTGEHPVVNEAVLRSIPRRSAEPTPARRRDTAASTLDTATTLLAILAILAVA